MVCNCSYHLFLMFFFGCWSHFWTFELFDSNSIMVSISRSKTVVRNNVCSHFMYCILCPCLSDRICVYMRQVFYNTVWDICGKSVDIFWTNGWGFICFSFYFWRPYDWPYILISVSTFTHCSKYIFFMYFFSVVFSVVRNLFG